MSYNLVEKKLKANGVVILDGGNGGELEISGAKMDKDLWAGKCAIDDPDKMLQVHEKYINAGADIITSNTYAITPISMKEYGYCLLYTSPSPRDTLLSRMPSSA